MFYSFYNTRNITFEMQYLYNFIYRVVSKLCLFREKPKHIDQIYDNLFLSIQYLF